MAKKKKYGPAESKWYRCAGVHKRGPKAGKLKVGYTVNPKGGCPKPAGKATKAAKAAACGPMIKKGLKIGVHKGVKACVAALPADIRSEWERRIERKTSGLEYDPSALGGHGRRRRRRRG